MRGTVSQPAEEISKPERIVPLNQPSQRLRDFEAPGEDQVNSWRAKLTP